MHPVVSIALATVIFVDTLVQWGLGWRYIFSASFRRSVRQRWQLRSRLRNIGEAIFVTLCFLFINAIFAVILWRLLVGPIRPIHEWRS
jgi:hypothetical protein